MRKFSKNSKFLLVFSILCFTFLFNPFWIRTSLASDCFLSENTIENIAERTGPAVVKIETEVISQEGIVENPLFTDPFFKDFFGREFQLNTSPKIKKGLGSGFIISNDGYILTNNHVIAGAKNISVFLSDNETAYPATIIGRDVLLDLAVLKINVANPLPTLTLGDSNSLKVGSWVVAIGNPYGLDHTVTVGVISAKGRPIKFGDSKFNDLLQTDASINPGNSGGPLLNLKGEVIGINTAVNKQAQGIGFAIPSQTVKTVLNELITTGKVSRPYLGVASKNVSLDFKSPKLQHLKKGALVVDVFDNSPAKNFGLQVGDIILKINSQYIKTTDDLERSVFGARADSNNVFSIFRDGQILNLNIILAKK